MGQTSELLKRYGGPILLGFGVFALVGAVVFMFRELEDLSVDVVGASLPLIAIGGVMLLVLLLTVVAMIFSILGLANKDQAMGLPEGSIRAVIALSLIVLFAILSVFLSKSISEGKVNIVAQLSDTDRQQFIRDHANLSDIQSKISTDKNKHEIIAKGADGKPLKNEDGTPQYLYDVTYGSTTNAASQDFAKQLLVLLGTLMTAITSFYLGAGTVTSAVTAGQAAAASSASPPPTASGISPTSHSIANDGPKIDLDVTGNNLNVITDVKIVSRGVQIVGTGVSSNATHVTCNIDVGNATPGTWDVVIDAGGSKSVTLPGALTITP
jgi:hypothetical protein